MSNRKSKERSKALEYEEEYSKVNDLWRLIEPLEIQDIRLIKLGECIHQDKVTFQEKEIECDFKKRMSCQKNATSYEMITKYRAELERALTNANTYSRYDSQSGLESEF